MNFIIKIKNSIQNYFSGRFSMRPMDASFADVRSWFSEKSGRRFLRHQKQALAKILPEMFGYYLMQVSVLGAKPLYKSSPITYPFSVISKDRFKKAQKKKATNVVVAELNALPIEGDSVDAIMLHHVLDFSHNPHQLLREAGRVVMPNGYVVIVGFNRLSLVNIIKYIMCFFTRSGFYRHRSFGVKQLKDWCKVLELETVHAEYGYHLPLFKNFFSKRADSILARCLPIFGQYYVLIARKDVNALNNIQVKWKKSTVLPQLGKRALNKGALNKNSLNKKSTNL